MKEKELFSERFKLCEEIVSLKEKISVCESQIDLLRERLIDEDGKHFYLLSEMDGMKGKIRAARFDLFGKTLDYLSIPYTDEKISADALKKLENAKRFKCKLDRERDSIEDSYFDNFYLIGDIYREIEIRETVMSICKFKIMVKTIQIQLIENRLIKILGRRKLYELLNSSSDGLISDSSNGLIGNSKTRKHKK